MARILEQMIDRGASAGQPLQVRSLSSPIGVGNIYTGQLTSAEKVIAYNSIVEEGFQAQFDRPPDLVYQKIAAVKTPADMDVPPGVIPTKVSFGFSPPNAKMNVFGADGRQARPLTQHSIEVFSTIYEATLYEERKNFDADVLGVLRKVPRDLRRVEMKNPDYLIAALFQNGKTQKDYRGENFWATGKACSPEGAISNTFDNLFTNTALTAYFVAQVIESGMSILAPDGIPMGVKYDTLVVPYSRWYDAVIATGATNIVFTGQNPAPGQVGAAINAAAAAENVNFTILKWIKQIVVFDLLQDGNAINNTTWYLLDCLHDGPSSFLYALFQPAEYASLMDPRDPNVFNNDKYYWGVRKGEGASYGLPQFAARCEQ